MAPVYFNASNAPPASSPTHSSALASTRNSSAGNALSSGGSAPGPADANTCSGARRQAASCDWKSAWSRG